MGRGGGKRLPKGLGAGPKAKKVSKPGIRSPKAPRVKGPSASNRSAGGAKRPGKGPAVGGTPKKRISTPHGQQPRRASLGKGAKGPTSPR